MSTNFKSKKPTKQIRISEHLHRLLKLQAVKDGKLMSKLADEILEEYFRNRKERNQNGINPGN